MAYQLGSTDGVPQNARAFRRFLRRHFPSLTIMLLAVMLVGTFLFPFIVITVPGGFQVTGVPQRGLMQAAMDSQGRLDRRGYGVMQATLSPAEKRQYLRETR